MKKFQVFKNDNEWKLKERGAQRSLKTFETKEEAVKGSAAYVKSHGGGSLEIRKENGRIQEERTYPKSADPKKSKG